MTEKIQIKIGNDFFYVLDSINYLTLADSFVLNKIGSGHGEGKLYVGNESNELEIFFDNLDRRCFLKVSDLKKYLDDASQEFLAPQQSYRNKGELGEKYYNLLEELDAYQNDILYFNIFRSDINPPRVYINSTSDYYKYMRDFGLPNISYVSILKIKDRRDEIFYYFKIFIDYKSDIVKYTSWEEMEQEGSISNRVNIADNRKNSLIQSRIGQGKYREKLLEDCQYCPFTLVNDERLLIASHIKPWVKCNDEEKVDPKNGFALTPTFDKLFDYGFISFNDDKTLKVSPWISPMNRKRLCIHEGKKLDKLQLDVNRIVYLEYHRTHIFKN